MTAQQSCASLTFRLAVAASLALLVAASPRSARAEAFETLAPRALLIDTDTETVLFEKDADARIPPASMGKLMTSAVIFDAIRSGKLSLDQEFTVSKRAWKEGGAGSGGSTMFARLGSSIKVGDLIKSVIIQSGNDACIVMAEGMAGTETAFADLMNSEARKIGLANSHFANATGLDDASEYTTTRDLAKLATYIIDQFPEFYKIYGETEFTWNKIKQPNRNPLLDMKIGADGMKTGYTEAAGYGLVGSAVQNGRRLILVVAGTKSAKERSDESRKLMVWGFNTFEKVDLFPSGAVVGEARVFGGTAGSVGLVSKAPVGVLLPHGARGELKAEIVYRGPVVAPVALGQPIGLLRITANDGIAKEQPLYAANDVAAGAMPGRAFDALSELLVGWW
jgi:D-alanyl-D-alanine carboxypeptidase (penicillin-binding protein 5/6)